MTWIMGLVMALVFISGISGMTSEPAPVNVHHAPDNVSDEQPLRMTEEQEWTDFHADSYKEHSDEFTALYEGYVTRWSKNGRLMMRNGDSGPYKFVKRSA